MSREHTIEIVPTCVPQSAGDLRATIEKIKLFSERVHLDINDGIFSRPYSWPYVGEGIPEEVIGEFDSLTLRDVIFDVHLMVSECREIGDLLARAGARSVIAHIESLGEYTAMFDAWRSAGVAEIGIAILLDTVPEKLAPLLPYCDFIHVLTVATIGAQGAIFDPRAIQHIETIRRLYPLVPLEVDGAVSSANIASLVRAGATRFSVGSAISEASNPADAYTQIKSLAESALQ